MHYYFFKEDFEQLNKQIEIIRERIKSIGKEMGVSCQEGAETFHDNFAYEDGARQQYMWSNKLRELIRIRNNAQAIEADLNTGIVAVGRTVTVQDINTQEIKTFKVGSYMVLSKQKDTISYNAPMAIMFIGAKIGDIKEGKIAGKKKEYKILDIQ
ncbi:GreA/GreB family elongation factor [Patescibacteria group bacterium]|nr:hypothetical protein [Candidatus Falkowbacteria bacterium]MBU3905598.1 GreA/GreB family elongation factor [Patescibacteria group bacterium]MBU4015791.1 GreA/GreB family elongation factor [Patescibacteria group bacterium]MBU4026283.1 GreA/GreB family elongation factor [Patescibacteria group bacterium]MBU4073069.1 GreA/GreB family elongation factor [Patescibacteria group bacterium]